MKLKKISIPEVLTIAAFFQAAISFLASMYFSDVAGYPPCTLCWYQRIAMFPVVIILFVSLLKKDWKVYQYVLPLALIGFFISLYHNFLYYNIIPATSITPCQLGISCTTKYVEILGIFTIPLLALIAFMIINVLMFWSWYYQNRK